MAQHGMTVEQLVEQLQDLPGYWSTDVVEVHVTQNAMWAGDQGNANLLVQTLTASTR